MTNDIGRGLAVGLGFCAAVALACSMEDSDGMGLVVKGFVLIWIIVISTALAGASIPRKDKTP